MTAIPSFSAPCQGAFELAAEMLSLSKHPGFAEARFAEALSELEGEAERSTQYRADSSTLRDQDSSRAVCDTRAV